MVLADRIQIARRFLRSIRIDSDLGQPEALDGFICPQSSADVLSTMTRHVSETGQGAFTWTGPYGSGKSSLVVALSALLTGDTARQKQARKVFGPTVTGAIAKALTPGKKGWHVIPVVGRRDDPVRAIGESLQANGLVSRKPRNGWTEKKLLNVILEAAIDKTKGYGGLILFIDEMGKFLEAAAQEGADIYIFQQLAEAAARSNGRLLVVGILHQAFEEYAHRLSHEMRDEWAKIQGRFVDLAVNVAGDEQVELISRAIESDYHPTEPSKLSCQVAAVARRERPTDADQFALTLETCWPLHPVVACLLGPISRRRFGQNQRSIFGFLNSAEPYGFQDFLRRSGDKDLYGPDQLWDYLRANLEPSILASPDGHRWALAAEALERCETIGGDAQHLKLLKTIAILDLFKERSGLLANSPLLKSCFPEIPKKALSAALNDLGQWSFITFRKFLDAYVIFAGSDFDIDQAVHAALDEIDEIDFATLKNLAGIQPILAKRHYHETGAQRWFDVDLVAASTLSTTSKLQKPQAGKIGHFLLAIPTRGESEEHTAELSRDAARKSDVWDIVVGVSKRSWSIETLARELMALEAIQNERPELAGDPVARREVAARLAAVQGHLEAELQKAFDGALWFRKHHKPQVYRQAELNSLASELADRRFNKAPRLHNELLNRQKPSSSAIAAQNALLRRMVINEGSPRLGIEGFPAEGGLLSSVLESIGLYMETAEGWRFVPPEDEDPHHLAPMWEAATEFVKANSDKSIAVSDIYAVWREQPYGVKDGIMPILAVAFILSRRDRIAIYREGIFRARFDDIDVEYLAKAPSAIQLRWMELSAVSRRLLSEMADLARALDQSNDLAHLEPIDVARGLVAIYEDLPRWTKRTMQLSENATRIRELFKRARDPNQFLFNDIPAVLSADGALTDEDDLQPVVQGVRDGLEELVHAYPTMLHRMRNLMLAELQVPNESPQSLAELRARAENIRQLAGDFQLDAFVGRVAQYDGTDSSVESIVSLVAKKPPRDWIDLDVDRTAVDIADMCQTFLRAETFTRVKGRPEKRHAMAVLIGLNGRPTPLLEEFDVADTEQAAVYDLMKQITATLEQSNTTQRSVILAALAELSSRYMQPREQPKTNGKEKVESQ